MDFASFKCSGLIRRGKPLQFMFPFRSLVFLMLSAPVGGAAEFLFFEPVQPPRPFQVMVHRGQSHQAPENTRPALQRCIEDGLEWAEVDVRLTQDGQHILSHNASVTDAAGKVWTINEHTLAELRQVDVGSPFAAKFAGERLLPLKDCFALCKGKLNLYLDCKAVNPEQLAREILEAGMERQAVVYLNLVACRKVQQASSGKVATMTKWRPGFGDAEWAVTNGLAAVEIDAPDLTPAIAASFHRAGIKVEAKVLGDWDRSEVWERVIAAGADWLQTDLPEEVIAQALWRRLPKRPVEISLHRGANRYAPENTLPAFAKAVRLGVDYVEFDVRTTSDGKFYLLHDSTLDGKTDGHGPIANAPSSVVAALSAGVKFGRPYARLGLPTLEEFLTATEGQIGLYFDAKAIPPEALAEAIERHHMSDRTVVYQSPKYLAQLKAINPRIRGLAPLGDTRDFAEMAANLKPYAVDADWDILSKDMIAQCHAAGVRVFSDALGKHERIEDYLQAMDWGIDLIQTDHPLRVMRAIELWANRNSSK
jgi:glycerophosphoryl diester phosphodiesterase